MLEASQVQTPAHHEAVYIDSPYEPGWIHFVGLEMFCDCCDAITIITVPVEDHLTNTITTDIIQKAQAKSASWKVLCRKCQTT